MESQLCKYFEGTTLIGTPTSFIFANCDPSLSTFIPKLTNLAKSNWIYQWLFMGNFWNPQTKFSKELITVEQQFSELSGMPASVGFMKLPKVIEFQTAFLQNKMLRVTEANKWLKKGKMDPEASGSFSLACFRFCLWPHLSPLLLCHLGFLCIGISEIFQVQFHTTTICVYYKKVSHANFLVSQCI